MKIVITHKMYLLPYQIKKLKTFGEVVFYENHSNSAKEWINKCSNADVICTEKKFINEENLQNLKNVLIIIPYRSNIDINKKLLETNNIVIKSFSREYKEAVSEWIIGMIFYYYRELHNLVRITNEKHTQVLKLRKSLIGKNITILGQGKIGNHVARICTVLGLNVTFYTRNDNLKEKIKNADIVVNCLRKNSSTIGLINKEILGSFKKGCFFISVAPPEIYDFNAIIYALEKGIFSAVADDASSKNVGNLNDNNYTKLLTHPNILATPHIAWMTDYEAEKTYDKMIEIIERWKIIKK